ncbi:hypothetical protein FISHEDRAFT_57064 [Fistulina hepatica ATCC 64428]|nr:hypothetical protein FISHEDRAFT_57064 [Fistulina hepatica ATCC 64428]
MEFPVHLVRIALYATLVALAKQNQYMIKSQWKIIVAEPIVAELLFSSIAALLWSGSLVFIILRRIERPLVLLFRDELIGLSLLWLFWVVGAGVASNYWGNLAYCVNCSIRRAIVAFAWLGWVTLLIKSTAWTGDVNA